MTWSTPSSETSPAMAAIAASSASSVVARSRWPRPRAGRRRLAVAPRATVSYARSRRQPGGAAVSVRLSRSAPASRQAYPLARVTDMLYGPVQGAVWPCCPACVDPSITTMEQPDAPTVRPSSCRAAASCGARRSRRPAWSPGTVASACAGTAAGLDGRTRARPTGGAGRCQRIARGRPRARHPATAPASPAASAQPSHDDRGARPWSTRFLDGEWQQVPGYGNQPLEPTMDGDTKVFDITIEPHRAHAHARPWIPSTPSASTAPGPGHSCGSSRATRSAPCSPTTWTSPRASTSTVRSCPTPWTACRS